jgi:phosphate transport system protein
MWKQLLGLLRKESLCEEAYKESLVMLRESEKMFNDSVASLWKEGVNDIDIYTRDRQINKFERRVRRNIVTHLAVSTNPDVTGALVLTAIVIDIERIGDYTKNIVELAGAHPSVFDGGELEDEIRDIEKTVKRIFRDLGPALESSDVERARQIIGDHQIIAARIEDHVHELIRGRVLSENSGEAVTAALYLRFLKRVSAHLKNVATSIVNPYYRIGFREKSEKKKEASPSE